MIPFLISCLVLLPNDLALSVVSLLLMVVVVCLGVLVVLGFLFGFCFAASQRSPVKFV